MINDPSHLDWCDHHPNIKPIRVTPHKTVDYVHKDGNIIFEEGEPPSAPSKQSSQDDWALIMSAPTKDEFIKECEHRRPRETILHWPSLLAYAEHKYATKPDPYISCEMTCHCEKYPQLTEWVQTYLRHPYQGRPKSLILFGATRLGKTLWARSLGPHAYFPGLFMLEGFNEELALFAIFDDLVNGLHTLPSAKHWLGGQQEFVIGDKYMKKRRIKWGKPSVYIANTNPLAECSANFAEWLRGNCLIVEIKDQLADAYIEELNP